MTGTGPAELLALWEAGQSRDDAGRAALLHAAAHPETGGRELPAVPVGEREADLFALRLALFGPRMELRAECGDCAEPLEFDLDVEGAARAPRPGRDPLRAESGGWAAEFRLPTVADLTAVASATGDPGEAKLLLLERCTASATRDGAPVPVRQLPDGLRQRMAEAAALAAPAADTTVDITCPACGTGTRAALDIAACLWAELDAWARDTLLDVHLLAGAYGWSEPEILALSPLRRRYYLELCADG
ncbi:hypothetical protein GCM10009716_35610 [Streptomyces sodiiphilus]|uniref:Phage baseplate protein n=1 Tax=Streptomyces sodiiphilus TaxID=226217 RepID=A0ABP5AXD9_9ACTN